MFKIRSDPVPLLPENVVTGIADQSTTVKGRGLKFIDCIPE